jgi:DNA replication protein DnaC
MQKQQRGKRQCDKCLRIFQRDYCEFCVRESRFDRADFLHQFSPRLKNVLSKIEFPVDLEVLKTLRQTGAWLLLEGKTGTGKSTLAASMLLESQKLTFIEKEGPSIQKHLFITSFEFEELSKLAIQSDAYKEKLQTIINCDFLVFDDFGTNRATDFVLDQVIRLISSRYENLKPTIFTTNLDFEQIANLYDDRIASRLISNSQIIQMTGEDRRIT